MLIRHYLRRLWQQQPWVWVGLLLAVITALAGVALLAVSGWFISATALAGLSIVSAHTFNYFAPGALVRGLSILRTVGRYGERLTTHQATLDCIAQLRADLFTALAARPWQSQPLDTHQSVSQLLNDIRHAEALYLNAWVPALVSTATLLLYLLITALQLPALLPWLVAPLLLVWLVIPFAYSHTQVNGLDQLHQQRSRQWRDASSLFGALRTLLLFQRLSIQVSGWQVQARQIDQQEATLQRRQLTLRALHQMVLATVLLLAIWQGLEALTVKAFAPVNLLMFLLLTLGVNELLAAQLTTLSEGHLGWRALRRIERDLLGPLPVDRRQWQQGDCTLLVLRGVGFTYPARRQPVLVGLDQTWHAGCWYWLSSASGSGKSTLVRLLAGQLQPDHGSITLVSTRPLPASIACLPQQVSILRASLRDNLCLAHDHAEDALWAVLRVVELDAWARGLPDGLDSWLGCGEFMPSGGEVRRLGLARVLLQNTPVILLDEPLAGLDHALAERIVSRLRQHWRDRLVVIASHDRLSPAPEDHEVVL